VSILDAFEAIGAVFVEIKPATRQAVLSLLQGLVDDPSAAQELGEQAESMVKKTKSRNT
jgi:hypothetical protein